jgi:peptidoglycan-associated lipoprotein
LALVLAAVATGCRTGSRASAAGGEGSGMGPEDEMPGATGTRTTGMGEGGLQAIYFDYDDSSLRPDAREVLRQNADLLKNSPSLSIQIEGNCDERGSDEYNLALGQRRADSARRYLMDLGVEGARLSTVSFGEENPAVEGSNEMAWSRNRRAEFKSR